jgi:hypothetical protein
MRGKVVVIQLLASSSDTAPQRTRSRDLFNVEQKNFYGEAVIEGAHSLSEINRIIQTHPESDVILIDHAIELPANGWLRRLIRALYARLGIAACAGLVCDSRGIVADLGGSMYSTGYTISPGYGADISSPAVVMRRYPSFLPAGIVGIRRESLQTVGNFCEELSTLRAALIDWCYRARSIGFALNIEHSCQGIASVELMNEMKQPPISSKRDRRILLQHLRDNCPEVLNV